MHPDYRELVERRFRTALPEAREDKRASLHDAIARFVRTGQSIHMTSTHTRPYGLAHELIRQHWGKPSELVISNISMGETWIAMFAGGFVRRVVTTFAGDLWPYPAPNPVVNRAWLSGRVEIEHWSILSLTLRLLAGALGLPFAATRSLVGSTMAEEHERAGLFRTIDDPFGSSGTVGLVPALRPDVTFVHVPACDVSGNAILTPPLGEGPLAAFAARSAVIVSTDRIVSTEYLRRHSALVRIPADLVSAVVELPLGGHPRGQTNVGCEDLDAYADDYAFQYEVRQASRGGEEKLREFLDHWILSCRDQEDFLRKLGGDRVRKLRGKAAGSAWLEELVASANGEIGDNGEPGGLSTDTSAYVGTEIMIVAAARKQAEIALRMGLRNVLAGIGAANLSAWLAHAKLREEGYGFETMAEMGYYGYEPRPGDPYTFNFKNTPTCIQTTDILSILGMYVSHGQNLGSLGAAQVSRYGAINSTCIPGKLHLLGSGGGNDVASSAAAVVVTTQLARGRFLESCDYVTSPGTHVRAVVTDRCVFEKDEGRAELVLTGYFRGGTSGFADAGQAVAHVRSQIPWDLRVADTLEAIDPPTRDELYLLRLFDPHRQFLR